VVREEDKVEEAPTPVPSAPSSRRAEISTRVRTFLGSSIPHLDVEHASVAELLATRRYETIVQRCTTRCDERLEALYRLKKYKELEEEASGVDSPRARLYYSIVPFLQGDALQSMIRLEKLLPSNDEDIYSWLSKIYITLGCPERLKSDNPVIMGRHCKAVGDIDQAELLFSDMRDLAMIEVARKEYPDAVKLLQQVDLNTLDTSGKVGLVNNLAVCYLYCQEIEAAVKVLEDFIRLDPIAHLLPCVAKNLLQLYEFLPDGADRKNLLHELVQACEFEDPSMPKGT